MEKLLKPSCPVFQKTDKKKHLIKAHQPLASGQKRPDLRRDFSPHPRSYNVSCLGLLKKPNELAEAKKKPNHLLRALSRRVVMLYLCYNQDRFLHHKIDASSVQLITILAFNGNSQSAVGTIGHLPVMRFRVNR